MGWGSVQSRLGAVRHGLGWRCGEAGRSLWPGPLAVGHPLPTKLAGALTLKTRSEEEGLGVFFLSFYLEK